MKNEGNGRILIVDDEQQIRRFLRISLASQGYGVLEAENGEQALAAVYTQSPDVVLLDLGLPDMDGHEVLQGIREQSAVPVIVVSVRDREEEKVLSLDNGANDYVTKPFKMREVAARVRALLRRSKNNGTSPGSVLQLADLQLNKDTRKALRNGIEITLTATEYRLLECFMNNPRRVLSRMDLLDSVWGVNYRMDTNVVDVYVNFLRKKVDKPFGSRLIHTVVGMGYVLKES